MYQRDIEAIIRAMTAREPTTRMHTHIGGGVFATVGGPDAYNYVNVRQYFRPQNEETIHPTKAGTMLTFAEWREFCALFDSIKELAPEFASAKLCEESIGHLAQRGYMECKECSPFVTDAELASYFY